MSRSATVAVVRSENRRGAVAQALHLIADDLRAAVAADVLIKPSLPGPRRQLGSTHADALSATLDAVLAAGGERVIVAEGGEDASAGFDRFGFRKEAIGRPVAFLDLDRQETAWDAVELRSVDGQPLRARVSRTIAAAPCRVSVAPAATHGTASLSLGLMNMLSGIHPDDRAMMRGESGADGPPGWKRPAAEFLDGDGPAAGVLARVLGRARRLKAACTGKARDDAWRRFARREIALLRTAETLARNLAALAGAAMPHISVVDGFAAMHREGPRHGTPIRLGTIIAGTDAVAVDAVASAVMGFDPMRIGHLRYAHEAGLGLADPGSIVVVGDPVAVVRRRCVPHSNHAILRHWDRLPEIIASGRAGSALPAPHVAIPRPAEPARR
ncbi:DUF362 domain-containing protein [Tundrisphaera sp. TA3]|uniref:DUF362 domain-containing protein n=1 Tax=Tundrisphaera sp. TA3 TaxID=3435775 RepID=UPI003EC0AAA4